MQLENAGSRLSVTFVDGCLLEETRDRTSVAWDGSWMVDSVDVWRVATFCPACPGSCQLHSAVAAQYPKGARRRSKESSGVARLGPERGHRVCRAVGYVGLARPKTRCKREGRRGRHKTGVTRVLGQKPEAQSREGGIEWHKNEGDTSAGYETRAPASKRHPGRGQVNLCQELQGLRLIFLRVQLPNIDQI